MKHVTKNGILAGMILQNMDEDTISMLKEQQEETKPSRINNKVFNKKKSKKRRVDDDYN